MGSHGLGLGGVGGWHNTLLGDGQGGGLRHGDGVRGTLVLRAGGDGDHGRGWAVGGVASHGDVLSNDGGVRVGGHGGGGEGRDSSDGGELHV